MGALANYKSYSYLKYSIYTNKIIPIGLYAVGAAAFVLVMIFSTVYTWRKVKRGNICEELRQEAEILDAFSKSLDSMRFRGKIVLEMGRFLAAFCGYYVTRIVDQKRNLGQNYCIVDGGIHHLNYFGQMMAMKIPKFCHVKQETEYTKSRTEQSEKEPVLNERGEEEAWNICGSLCTVSDVIVKQLPLVDAKIGDVLVFERTGAYSVTEGIYLFLSRDLPQIFFWSEENGLEQIRGALPTNEWNSVH